ncbi:hypothetical protein Dimus_002915, partial [Dionaea muscipula]
MSLSTTPGVAVSALRLLLTRVLPSHHCGCHRVSVKRCRSSFRRRIVPRTAGGRRLCRVPTGSSRSKRRDVERER